MSQPFSFCLCADDYAMTPGVSRGILEALEAGALTATSAMTTFPTWAEAAPALRPHVGRADLGLHLNLTLGAPLGPMPTLAPGGRLPGIGTILRLARGRRLPLDEVAAEVGRQLDRFAAVLGRPPDHVDGHQHVHVVRPIRPILLAALAERGWRPWLRDSADRPDRVLRRGVTLTKALGLSVVARRWRAQATAAGFATNEGFAGYSAFATGEAYGALFARYLKCPGARHLVMCHPGYVEHALRALDPVVDTRENELAFLTSTTFGDIIARAAATPSPLSAMSA